MKNRDFNLKAILDTHLFRKMSLKQWRILILLALGVFYWMGMFGLSSLHAATLCVNPGGTNGCYALPSAAVSAAANGDTILVHPGTYTESQTITITKLGLKIMGDNPQNTKIINPTNTVITINASAEIAGLQITGVGNGIYVNATTVGSSVILHHNNIVYNKNDGIEIISSGNFVAFNNVILSNDGMGINGQNIGGPYEVVYNNIVAYNTSTGIDYVSVASYNSVYGNGGNIIIATSKIDNISLDCLFVDNLSGDYRLQPSSPCKDMGDPGYLDVDGTRSDIGSFGGPGAALFWPYGDGGPVVTNLTVDPPYVPEGGNISIKATVEIR